MFRHLEQTRRGVITHVIVYKFDRFSRDVDDGATYRLILRKLGIALRSATERTDDSPAGRMTLGVLSVIGQFDNEQRAERTLTGMKSRLASGRWQWIAPFGYKNGGKGQASLLPDPVRGPFVVEMFEMVASGEHTKAAALAHVTALGMRSAKGRPLSQETIRKMFINPIYAGHILIPNWGQSVRGDFDALVSQDVFDRVQAVLSGRAAKPARRAKRADGFPLRGSLLCGSCMGGGDGFSERRQTWG